MYWIWSIWESGVKDDTMICDQSTWSDGDTIGQNEGDGEKSWCGGESRAEAQFWTQGLHATGDSSRESISQL